ncbi:MAG: FliO/MopB family protein [Candidatus Bruticola sp.]
MSDFESLLKQTNKGKRHSLLSVGAVCFLAFVFIIGLGIFDANKLDTLSRPQTSQTRTGKDLLHEVMEQEKSTLEQQLQQENQSKTALTIKPPNSELAERQTVQGDTQTNTKTKETIPQISSISSNSKPSQYQDSTHNLKSSTGVKAVSPPNRTPSLSDQKPLSSIQATAAETNKSQDSSDNPYFSILNEPWPPSSAPGATKVESTFLPRLASMFFMLCITCVVIWLSIKVCLPIFNKFANKATSTTHNRINIIERKALAPNKLIVLIETHGRHLLLGVTEQSISSLASFDIETDQIQVQSEASTEAANSSSPSNIDKLGQPADMPQDSSNSADINQGKKPNLVKEVIDRHLSSLPLIKN